MTETSGFATDLAQSAILASTMRRAISAAQQRSHRYVTLEHLLLALLDDPDAQAMLEALRVDRSSMKSRAADTVNRNLATLYTPGQFDLRASYKVERVLQTASDDARRLNCTEVDAAFVLAALAREMDSPAADIIKATGLSFTNAVTWLYGHRGSSRAVAKPAPAPVAPTPAPVSNGREVFGLEDDVGEFGDELEILDDADEPPPSRTMPPAAPASRAEAHEAKRRVGAPAVPANGAGKAPPILAAPAARDDTSPQVQKRSAPIVAPAPRRADAALGPAVRSAEEAAPPPAPKLEPKIPSASRLDEMRVRPAGSSSAPVQVPVATQPQAKSGKAAHKGKRPPGALAPAPAPAKAAGQLAPAPNNPKQVRRQRRQQWLEAQAGRLLENIPRRMRVAVPELVEVRISREETDAISRGFEGRGEVVRHDILVSQAMSVMLRAPDGGFAVETLSPETQWTSDGTDHRSSDTYGRWRWAVTPKTTGKHRLQLIVAARTVDENGMTGDTALPDQMISVSVRTNIALTIKRALAWLVVMAAGGVVTEIAVNVMKSFTKFTG